MGDVKKSTEVMTQMAEFECRKSAPRDKEGFSYEGDFVRTEQRPVTIRVISGELPVETKDRFEKAAEIELFGIEARKEIKECQALPISFTRFVSTAPEFLKAKAEWDKASKELATKTDQALSKIYEGCRGVRCMY